MNTIKVEFWKNIGNTKFLHWVDRLHPLADDIFWRSTQDLFWDAQTNPEYRNRYPELKPTDSDIAQDFEFWQKIIKDLMNIDAHIDWEQRELILEIPVDLYVRASAEQFNDIGNPIHLTKSDRSAIMDMLNDIKLFKEEPK